MSAPDVFQKAGFVVRFVIALIAFEERMNFHVSNNSTLTDFFVANIAFKLSSE